ncbi:hypothetical protein AOQ88_00015 (plasmid) [Candidatus Riesia sp. GBBU]|nr:hypothetical protein AOQ88_00015 [Candidatus Riesia sp. GBBU]
MGKIHRGHISLLEKSKLESPESSIIVSIFVNPLQFDSKADYDSYPKSFERDLRILEENKVDFVFSPSVDEMYPCGFDEHTLVSVPYISEILIGKVRKGHFNGVATVLGKLFNMVKPDFVVFGEKDYQQLALVRKMVYDMNYDIEVLSSSTERESDGLAISSRNVFLSEEDRKIAPKLKETMESTILKFLSGFTFEECTKFFREEMRKFGFSDDNFSVLDSVSLKEISPRSELAIAMVSARLGRVTLLDNKIFPLPEKRSNFSKNNLLKRSSK